MGVRAKDPEVAFLRVDVADLVIHQKVDVSLQRGTTDVPVPVNKSNASLDVDERDDGGPRLRMTGLRRLIAVSLMFTLSACPPTAARPERVVTPDAIGIIAELETSEDGTTTTIQLEDGQAVVLRNPEDIEITGSANEGELIVSGMLGDVRWSMFLRSGPETGIQPESCYVAGTQPFDDGDAVIFPASTSTEGFGIRLEKAEDFAAEPPNAQTSRWGSFDGVFCLNEEGPVTGQAEELRRESE